PVDAGIPRDRRRPTSRPAGSLPRARDTEPARAGRHLSAARGAARQVSDAGRHPLSRAGGRAAHPAGNDRRRGCSGRKRAFGDASPGNPDAHPAHAGARERGGGDPVAGALRAAGTGQRRDRQARFLGSRPTRQPGADALRPRSRPLRRTACAIHRRRARARRTRAPAPHGAHLRGSRRRHERARRRDQAGESGRLMARVGEAAPPVAARDALARARLRASLVPDLLVEARRVVNTVIAGWHGRRKRGIGENFWQFRPYVEGESVSRIDWRRSARDDHTYIRDREWEAAHTVSLWSDPSPSMLYKSRAALISKESRALVLILALTELLSRSGERIAWPGLTDAF